MNYLKKSISKFRQDVLSKLFYDLLKGFLVTLLVFAASIWLPKTTSIYEVLMSSVSMTLYVFLLTGLVIITLTILGVSILFSHKYKILKNVSYTDELTGLRNHRAFQEYLSNKIVSNSVDRTFSIIIIDVDDFKKFNTNFSYNIADKILGKLGELLGNDKRATDETFRLYLRGDEFIVVASDTNLNDAVKAAERKRLLIANTTLIVDGKPHELTVSCGVTEFKKNSDDFASLTDRANKALVVAKGISGKNNTKSTI